MTDSSRPADDPPRADRPDADGDNTESDDELELELEPIDPAVLAHGRRRAQEKTAEALRRVDVDELFREREERELSFDPEFFRQFRFTTRHLLIMTALLAVVMAMRQKLTGCMTLFILAVVMVSAGWIWVTILERRREAERLRRRQAFLADDAPSTPPEPVADAAPFAPSGPRFAIDVSFSTRQMLIAVTAAAVLLGLLRLVSTDVLALTMGLVALGGVVVNALGFDPPRMVVLGWWVLLALYLVFGFLAAVTAS